MKLSNEFCIAITSYFFYRIWQVFLKERFFIRFTIIPFYDKLACEFSAKYPTVMDNIHIPSFGLSARNNLENYCYLSKDSFILVSSVDPNFHAEIPFDTLLYHESYSTILSKHEYYFSISFTFMQNGREERLSFTSIDYNHKLDKKYGIRLSGEELFNFIDSTFIDKKLMIMLTPFRIIDLTTPFLLLLSNVLRSNI